MYSWSWSRLHRRSSLIPDSWTGYVSSCASTEEEYLAYDNEAEERFWSEKERKCRDLRVKFTLNSKREFVPRDKDFSLIVVYCLLLLLENKQLPASFTHKNGSEQFLSVYFLFWDILNLNLTFAVGRKRDS